MKTIIISGANGNLGSVVTRHFLDLGYRVIASVYSEAHRDFLHHPNLQTVIIDLSDEVAARALVQNAVERYGQIHAALMLVGGFTAGDIQSTTGTEISTQISLNFNTAYFVSRPLLDHMRQFNHGRLIFMGARPALAPSYAKNVVAYSLSKSLLFKLAEIINEEAKGTDITATVIAPGTIDTPANRRSMPDANHGDWVKPEHFAQIMEFILSENSSPLKETVLKVYGNS